MLQSLAIRDIVLIDRLELGFGPGLSVLTGETGAGKSILLDALGLALGSRAEAGLVRSGAEQASATATFEPDSRHPVRAVLAERGIDNDGPLILRRVLSADGRSRAFVNDQPVSVALLREIGESLVEIHGQFETVGLLDSAHHRAALDAFGGLDGEAANTAAAFQHWRAAQSAEAAAREETERSRRDEDYLRHVVAELDQLAPKPGEEAELAGRRAILAAREKLLAALTEARGELSSGRGIDGALRAAQRHLERAAPLAQGRLDAALAALDRAAVEAADAVALVVDAGRVLDLDAADLEKTEERLFALRAVARKHKVAVDDLAKLREDLATRLGAIDDSTSRMAKLAAATAASRAAYVSAAEALSAKRRAAAAKLDREVMRELPPLKLEKARFRTRVDSLAEAEWNATGADRTTFEVATNPGAEPGPLAKIASGGELARFMLALKVVLARTASAPTLIFDEVDAGLGGAAAAAVGERLARLAERLQVLVVTHSPQVAARGTAHWRVAKRVAGAKTTTLVTALDADARREEIARLLSGATITDAARAAADSLLGAGEPPLKRRARS